MKKQIIAGLVLIPILGSSIILMTACGGSEDSKTLSDKMESAITAVTKSESFSTRELTLSSVGGGNYKYYVPNYQGDKILSLGDRMATDTRKALIETPSEITSETNLTNFYKQFTSEREVIASFYDLPFGVSFNIIQNNADIIKNNITDLDMSKGNVSGLISSLDNFISKTTVQSREIDRLNQYIASIGGVPATTSSIFNIYQNALYNYKKDYQEYVRTTINLAKESSKVVEEICPNVSYEEQLSTQLAEDIVFSFGNKLLISAGQKVQITEINGTESVTYKLRYIDKSNLVWDFSTSEEFEDVKVGDRVELTKDFLGEVTFLGRKVVKDQKVKVVSVAGTAYFTAQFTDDNGIIWEKVFATNSEYVKGEIAVDKEVSLTTDIIFTLKRKVLVKGTVIAKVGEVVDGIQTVRYTDDNNYVWEANVSEAKITTVPPTELSDQFYKLAEAADATFKGKNIVKNTKVEVISEKETSELDVSYLGKEGFVWTQTISKSQSTRAEKSYFMNISLDILDDYYSLLVEDMESKFLTTNEKTEAGEGEDYLITITSWMNDYLNFMKKVLVQKSMNVEKKFSTEDLAELNKQYEVVKVSEELARAYQTKFNPIKKRFIDNNEFTNEEYAVFRKISKYYQEILLDWIDYYTTKI